jgi:head-tail adaptor
MTKSMGRLPRFNVPLELQTTIRTADNAGGFDEAWQPLGTLWAELTARDGSEILGQGGPVGQTRYRVVVRAAPVGSTARPAAGQRFMLQDRPLTIRAVTEMDSSGRYLTCLADAEVTL